ncbi:4-hydroxybenzoate octaprenyltransferase [bacterium]|nr:MAG: 4-hydroxybenzoate octaprenyltransferase [bacterium]
MASSLPRRTWDKMTVLLELVKFSHTLFALPFALAGALLAGEPWPSAGQFFWILVAMIGARTGAMGFNRLADEKLDTHNPRTRDRPLSSGRIGRREVIILVVLSFALLSYAAYRLNPLCFALSPLAIAWVCFYSYTKRFSWGSHFVLGFSLALAPVGAWLAVRGTFSSVPIIIGMAVLTWVAGFDILYALQDLEFDRKKGLYSIPAIFGIRYSLVISRLLHAMTVLLLFSIVGREGMGWLYGIGIVGAAALLILEHSLISEEDLSRLDAAFFTANSFFSVIFLLAVIAGKIGS